MRLISRAEVLNRTSFSRATLFRKERLGEFPKAIRISTNRVAYDEIEIDAWVESRIREARSDVAA